MGIKSSTSGTTKTVEFSFKINVWQVFGILALLYIVPVHNPVQSLAWWAVTVPLWIILPSKLLARTLKRKVLAAQERASALS